MFSFLAQVAEIATQPGTADYLQLTLSGAGVGGVAYVIRELRQVTKLTADVAHLSERMNRVEQWKDGFSFGRRDYDRGARAPQEP